MARPDEGRPIWGESATTGVLMRALLVVALIAVASVGSLAAPASADDACAPVNKVLAHYGTHVDCV